MQEGKGDGEWMDGGEKTLSADHAYAQIKRNKGR